jgi:DNA-binding beta-propeller fold protein YncE
VKRPYIIAAFALLIAMLGVGAKKDSVSPNAVPVLLLDGGRRLDYVRSLSSEQDLHQQRRFFSKMIDFIAGAPEWHRMARPYGVITDSRGRILVTDPGIPAVHIFDVSKNKYTFIDKAKREPLRSPIGIAVDGDDNIYVADSQLGKVLVYDSNGKYRRTIGEVAKGEGFYKRPTGIAIDRQSKRVFITDTLRDRVYITDLAGNVIKYFGVRGNGAGEFNFPTELRISGDTLYVVDAMNFRVQSFDLDGNYRANFGAIGEMSGAMFRPKGVGVDRDGNLYLVDAAMEMVQVFTPSGQLLYAFGHTGSRPSEFELPSGAYVDGDNRIYIADSYNHRVQVFQFVGSGKTSVGDAR